MDTDKRVPVRLSHTLNTLKFVLFTEGIKRHHLYWRETLWESMASDALSIWIPTLVEIPIYRLKKFFGKRPWCRFVNTPGGVHNKEWLSWGSHYSLKLLSVSTLSIHYDGINRDVIIVLNSYVNHVDTSTIPF